MLILVSRLDADSDFGEVCFDRISGLGSGLWLGLGSEEVFMFDSKSENRIRAVEAVSEARAC